MKGRPGDPDGVLFVFISSRKAGSVECVDVAFVCTGMMFMAPVVVFTMGGYDYDIGSNTDL